MLSFLINKCYKINHKGNPCFKGKNNQDPLNYNWVKSNPFIIWVKMSIDPITNAAKKNTIANAAKTIGTFFFGLPAMVLTVTNITFPPPMVLNVTKCQFSCRLIIIIIMILILTLI